MKTHTALTTRRHLLTSATAAAALAVPTAATAISGLPAATGDDPMIEAVARHRQAWLAYNAACDYAARTQPTTVCVAPQAVHDAREVMIEAAEALSNASATTVAGVVAVLEYFAELSADDELDSLFEPFVGHTEIHGEFLRGLAETLCAVAYLSPPLLPAVR